VVSGEPGLAPEQLSEIQRSRLLGAAVAVLDELGYENTTVAHITARAGVSRRTFYEQFANREACVAAILGEAAARIAHDLAHAGLAELGWRERMRGGLWGILCFLTREPVLARVLLVHTTHGGGEVQRAREEQIARLVALVDDGRRATRAGASASCSELTAEGVVGAVVSILQARLARGGQSSLRGLQGELCAMIVLPYLGVAAARREQARREPSPAPARPDAIDLLCADPLAGLPMRMTYRTARVLEGIGRQPGSSNRQAAQYAGVVDQGQISKLLSRLERLELLVNRSGGPGKGEANAWMLTPRGASIARAIGARLESHANVGPAA
jgi:AcrR family transcriptional regulator